MKLFGRKREQRPEPTSGAGHTLERREVVVGAGVVGAAALAAHVLPGSPAAPAAAAAAAPSAADGYRLSAHVQRYYETTKA